MNAPGPSSTSPALGLALRTALISWAVTISTVLLFAIVIIPLQKRTYLENLESKARGLAISLHNVVASATINEDYSSVVDSCRQILDGDPTLEYLVITKNDGFTLFNDRQGWRIEKEASRDWRPEKREPRSSVGAPAPVTGEVFHYSMPFDHSGLQWGWVHVGLSLDGYNRNVATLYWRTGLLTAVCFLLSFVASGFYASRMVEPILRLQRVVRDVASGNLSAHAEIRRNDELGELADQVNAMTNSLSRRDRIMESIRYTSQTFLMNSAGWDRVLPEVLTQVGSAATVSRLRVWRNHTDGGGKLSAEQIQGWQSADCPTALEATTAVFMSGLLEPLLKPGSPLLHRTMAFNLGNPSLPDQVRGAMDTLGAKSLLLIPIMVEGRWWGGLSVADCVLERQWTDGELYSFNALASILGSAIERQLTHETLVKAKEAAEAASQAKSQFLANMSHEIRTPITGVMGMLQLLERTSLDKRQARYASSALTSADTLLTVIGDVLDFSKIEAGKLELEEQPFTPLAVVETVVRLFAARAENNGVELAYRVSGAVPRSARGDSNRIRQILVNLIGNAVKFTTKGEIIVTCQRTAFTADTTVLRFEVRDTGCGIAPEKQRLIFDPFTQADNSMTRRYGGTGLGLTISRQLCELMGGKIGVVSTPGRGSTFWFTVTLKNQAGESQSLAPFRYDLSEMRVLIVDDCLATREICCEYVASWHGIAEEAEDGRAGLQKLKAAVRRDRPFHVAVLDWKMPDLDGMALARAIKEDPALSATPLILLSNFSQHLSLEETEHAGFVAFVPKPASPSDLYNAILTAAKDPHASAPAKSPGARPDREPGRCRGNVLLAEDNEINYEVVTEMLSTFGYRPHWVHNGAEAVRAWQEQAYDLILMDCQMPEMDGYEATGVIRQHEAGFTPPRRIPIVALTAHAAKGDRERCLASGMDDYLTKPLDPDTLVRMLEKWIPPAAVVPASAANEAIQYSQLLRRCLGKPDLAMRMVRKLIEQGGTDIRDILAAVQGGDAAALAASAHRLKGASALVAAEELRAVAAELEAHGRSGQLAAASGLLDRLQTAMARTQAAAAALETPS